MLLIAVAALKYMQSFLSKAEFRYLFTFATLGAAGVVFSTVVVLTYAGVIAPWSGRFVFFLYKICQRAEIKK